jgi:hypothetical protein
VAQALRPIYTAPSREAARDQLEAFATGAWGIAAAAADNASATDGTPPVAPQVPPVRSVPAPTLPSLVAEHMLDPPMWSRPVTGSQDVAALRYPDRNPARFGS